MSESYSEFLQKAAQYLARPPKETDDVKRHGGIRATRSTDEMEKWTAALPLAGIQPIKGNLYNALTELASLQRGKPEAAMLRVQNLGGGVINPVVEHLGDVIHRAYEPYALNYEQMPGAAGLEFVKPKLDKVRSYLRHPYGFEREFEENIINNAKFNKVSEGVLRSKMYDYLKRYAEAHTELPSYNEATELMKAGPVAVGERRFNTAADIVEEMLKYTKDKQTWSDFVLKGLR